MLLFHPKMLSWTDGLLIVCDNSNLKPASKEIKDLTETTSTSH